MDNFSPEFIFFIITQCLTVGIIIGVYKTTISFMQRQIEELKEDMRKYNNVLERLIRVEDKASSAHKRLDEWIK